MRRQAWRKDFTSAAIKLKRQQEAYAEFSKAAGMYKQAERAQVVGFGHSQASRASWMVRKTQGVEKNEQGGIIKENNKNLADYVGKPIIKTDNQHIREWYCANVSTIPNQIDRSKTLEEQARQAFSLRNQYKRQARIAMSDKETVEILEKERPVPTFDELLESKIRRKNITREEALKDILETASKTNSDVNKEFGL